MARKWSEVEVGEGPYGVALVGDDVWTTLVNTGVVARVSGFLCSHSRLRTPRSETTHSGEGGAHERGRSTVVT
jgi:hypothetical protein